MPNSARIEANAQPALPLGMYRNTHVLIDDRSSLLNLVAPGPVPPASCPKVIRAYAFFGKVGGERKIRRSADVCFETLCLGESCSPRSVQVSGVSGTLRTKCPGYRTAIMCSSMVSAGTQVAVLNSHATITSTQRRKESVHNAASCAARIQATPRQENNGNCALLTGGAR